MYKSILSGAFHGMESFLVQVEADISDGLPCMDMIGYLSSEVKETRERVRVGIKNSGYQLPVKRITINLSPADIRKGGSAFDLPVALALLAASGQMDEISGIADASRMSGENEEPEKTGKTGEFLVLGEMGLDGTIKPVKGVFPILMHALDMGISKCIVPIENREEAEAVDGMQVWAVRTLAEAVAVWTGKLDTSGSSDDRNAEAEREKTEKDESGGSRMINRENKKDFADVCGQEMAKRAAEIAAAGFHNLLLVGPPGSGKSMIAERIPTIMPLMSREESIAVTKICSMAGKLQKGEGMVRQRPFLQPHHTITAQALVGGGNTPMPGIVTLAHRGVLFLDELPEFGREKLDLLRQPVEDKKIQVIRARYACTYPSDFLFVGAMNPCPCGYYPDLHKCNCTDQEREKYQKRISGALLNRLDICAEAGRIEWGQLQKNGNESSAMIAQRVQKAIDRQKKRYKRDNKFNADLTNKETMQFCRMNPGAERILERTYTKYQLNPRSLFRIRRLARTIADLVESDEIKEAHVSEAIALNKGLWHA